MKTAVPALKDINAAAGNPAKTAIIVHEDSAFGTGTAGLLAKELPGIGIEVLDVIKHPTPTLDFNNIVLTIKAKNPDIVIPANYYNEYVMLARTMQQQKVQPKAIYSVLGGGASQYKFVKEFPEAAQYIMDCNHWFNPKNPAALDLKKRIEAKDLFYTYEVFLNYTRGDAAGRCAGARRLDRPRQDHGGAGVQHLERPLHALRPHQVRERPEHRRARREPAGAGQRHQGDPAGGVRQREADLPDAGLADRRVRPALGAPPAHAADMLGFQILLPAILNGLATGAVYALVALGLTLIYGVLHIVNFAHGSLLMLALYGVYFLYTLLGIDPYLALPIMVPAMFALGYALQRTVIAAASHGREENILLVTLGLSIVIDNLALLSLERRHPHHQSELRLRHRRLRRRLHRGAQGRLVRGRAAWSPALLWLLIQRTDLGKAIRALARERQGAQLVGIDVEHVFAMSFGIGIACLGAAACLLLPSYYVHPGVGESFVLIAFTIVVLGGMGSFVGALRRRLRDRRSPNRWAGCSWARTSARSASS